MKDSISEGKSLAEALSAYPRIFNRLYINMVQAGETSGKLGLVLERLADHQEYQVAIKGKVFSALSYPAIMIVASLALSPTCSSASYQACKKSSTASKSHCPGTPKT